MNRSVMLIVGIAVVLVTSGCTQKRHINLETCAESMDTLEDLKGDIADFVITSAFSPRNETSPFHSISGTTGNISYVFYAYLTYESRQDGNASVTFIKFGGLDDYAAYIKQQQAHLSRLKRLFDVRASTSDFLGYDMLELEINVPEHQKSYFVGERQYSLGLPRANSVYHFAFKGTDPASEKHMMEEYLDSICARHIHFKT